MNDSVDTLYYIHDPMCSWCWGFRPVWQQVQQALSTDIEIKYVLGGLAKDSDEAMPESMQITIQDNWARIQQEIPNTVFNYDFWTNCKPRRSTYAACRAIIATKIQQADLEQEMLLAIQRAYYIDAKNPSDIDVLIKIAESLPLDLQKFCNDIQSEMCQNQLEQDIELSRELHVYSYPSLVLKRGKSCTLLDIDYNNSNHILKQII